MNHKTLEAVIVRAGFKLKKGIMVMRNITLAVVSFLFIQILSNAQASENTVVLTYSDEAIIELVSTESVDKSAIKGNQVVIEMEHGYDAENLAFVYEEFAPTNICYTGSLKAAKTIVEEVVYNTDSNGDYYLDYIETTFSGSSFTVDFTVVSEAGSEQFSIEADICKKQ
ncbi:MAG: hypothetical protein HOE90_09410 [Bacteriovoracaceae bacterium]|nr:hypothetical protein [Bacteriovoracaceae bacterium]